MSGALVLVVDDEPQILRALQTNLRGAGYEVATAATAEQALSTAATRRPTPSSSTSCSRTAAVSTSAASCARGARRPILVLSVVGDETEKVAALDAGADDYVQKPFGIDELLARLRALLRRATPSGEPVLEVGELSIDLEKRLVSVGGRRVQLTPNEFDLLRVLAQNEGKLMTHPAILREVWGPAYSTESHYLHVYVSQLRRKLEDDPARPRYLLTEAGAGYRLVNPVARS